MLHEKVLARALAGTGQFIDFSGTWINELGSQMTISQTNDVVQRHLPKRRELRRQSNERQPTWLRRRRLDFVCCALGSISSDHGVGGSAGGGEYATIEHIVANDEPSRSRRRMGRHQRRRG